MVFYYFESFAQQNIQKSPSSKYATSNPFEGYLKDEKLATSLYLSLSLSLSLFLFLTEPLINQQGS
jgi:hypothetical protein